MRGFGGYLGKNNTPTKSNSTGIWHLKEVTHAKRGDIWPLVIALGDIVTDGLVLHLNAAFSSSYPGTGNIWYDLTAFERNATFTSTPTFNTTYFTIADNTVYAATSVNATTLGMYDSSYSCEAVFSVVNTSGDNMVFGNTGFTRAGLHLGTRNTTFHFGHYSADTSSATGLVSTNTIYHVIWTFERGATTSGTATIWVNGSSVKTATINSYIGTTNLNIGTGFNTSTTRFGGDLYYVRIYNRALSSAEVAQNYNAYIGV
jgi:hypothetical protein